MTHYISHNFCGRGELFNGTLEEAIDKAKEIAHNYNDYLGVKTHIVIVFPQGEGLGISVSEKSHVYHC